MQFILISKYLKGLGKTKRNCAMFCAPLEAVVLDHLIAIFDYLQNSLNKLQITINLKQWIILLRYSILKPIENNSGGVVDGLC